MSHLIGFLQFVMGVPSPDAEELGSDVLLKVSSKIHTFKHGSQAKLTTWIFEIAKNRAVDFHRKQKLRPEHVALSAGTAKDDGPNRAVGRNKRLSDWLAEQMKEFAETDRQLLLWRASGFPYSQIAMWLGMSEGAARTRHTRLHAKLIEESKSMRLSNGGVSE
jgi:RNA polymerase sigma factor (sigma-70 family)